MVDQLQVKQQVNFVFGVDLRSETHFQVEALEVITGFEGANKYKVGEKKFPSSKLLIAQVLNSAGQEVYKVMEDTDCCTRQVILSY